MRRLRGNLLLIVVLLSVVAGALSGSVRATPTDDTPFYIVPPSPSKECHGIKGCVGVNGPWVVVPARGQVSFLLGCPRRQGYLVGGTDARASSNQIRVTYDGQIGVPVGQSGLTFGAFLLFHAISTNGRVGSFQPLLGCIRLQVQSTRSTVSARVAKPLPGTAPSVPLDLRATYVPVAPGAIQHAVKTCLSGEKLVGSWSALAFATTVPPDLSHVSAVKKKTSISDGRVHLTIVSKSSLPSVPLAEVQLGAMCAP